MKNQPYQAGYEDGQNGSPNRWVYMNNPSYLRGYMDGFNSTLPKAAKRWWWPF